MKRLTIELHPFCLLDCPHCSHDKEGEKEIDHPEFEDEEILQLISSHPEFKAIMWSGGEPLNSYVSQQLVRLLHTLKSRELRHTIFTSGVYDKILDNKPGDAPKLKEVPLELMQELSGLVNNLCFSVYGPEEVHDRVTRKPGSYVAMNKSLDNARISQIPFSFNFVATTQSISGLEDAVKYAVWKSRVSPYLSKLPTFTILRFIKQGQGAEHPELALSQEQLVKSRESASSLREHYKDDLDIIQGCSFAEERCIQGTGKAALTSNGNIVGCSALKSFEKPTTERFPCRIYW